MVQLRSLAPTGFVPKGYLALRRLPLEVLSADTQEWTNTQGHEGADINVYFRDVGRQAQADASCLLWIGPSRRIAPPYSAAAIASKAHTCSAARSKSSASGHVESFTTTVSQGRWTNTA